VPAVFVSPSLRERQLREALQKALQQQDAQALRQLSDRLVHRHGPVQLQRWMQALASEPQQLFWRQALAQPSKPVQQPSIALEEPPVVEERPAVEEHPIAEESAPPVEETLVEQPPAPAPAPIKTALQGWLPQWDGPQIDRLAS
jgi:hypothetical protein